MDMDERIKKMEEEGEAEFQRTYKVTVPTFKRLAQELHQSLDLDSDVRCISAELRLSMALRYFAGGHQNDICKMHGVHNSTFYKVVWQVVDFINSTMRLSFPLYDQEKLQDVASGFSRVTNGVIRKCAGAIDGIAVQIKCPGTADHSNPMQFYNRKGFYAWIMQGVCDANLR